LPSINETYYLELFVKKLSFHFQIDGLYLVVSKDDHAKFTSNKTGHKKKLWSSVKESAIVISAEH
jgi:hypothetical protein